MLYFAVIAGAIIALLLGWNEALAKPDYIFLTFFRQNIIPTLLNMLCGCVLVYFKDDLANIYPIKGISAVILGTSGQFIFKKVTKIFNPESETKIGING